jgi:hypothetical protein
MRTKAILLTVIGFICLWHTAYAQEWGPMEFIYWQNPYPVSPPGVFNPSYCDADSLLYFDTCLRFDLGHGSIWVSKFTGFDDYGMRIWTDPERLPEPINLPETTQIANAMPCISGGGDTLFFCSERPGTYGGLDIWMSVKEDSLWGEPVNLGDSVNSSLDELKPHYVSATSTLFFDRLERPIGYYFAIYESRYLGHGVWQTPQRLPEVINPPGGRAFSAFFDEQRSVLYFVGPLSSDTNECISKSAYRDGNWQEPEVLSDNVNGYFSPNICGAHPTRDPWLSSDGRLLFYSKEIWQYECIDFTSFLFLSETTLGIEEGNSNSADELSISVYPNPSNSRFYIKLVNVDKPFNLKIYNLLGQLVREFSNVNASAISWDSKDMNKKPVCSGLYFAVLEMEGTCKAQKLLLMK